MKSDFKHIGDYIQLVDERNVDLQVTRLLGINITKNYMPSVANTSGVDLSRYKIVRKGRFACNIMHVGRDERLPIALFADDEPAIVSPAYLTFEVINTDELLPEFLIMIFQQAEFDRFTWFVSDSSVRGGLEWGRFCEIEIPIPDDIENQKRYVAIYNELINNQQCYEKSLDDLKLICDSFMDALIVTEESKILGDYIDPVEERNSDLQVTHLRGVSTSKKLIKSVANLSGVEFYGYKVVRTGKFVYVSDTSRRGDKIALAMNEKEDCIVSSIYTVFEVKKDTDLIPEFLFIWFKRPEFDRYARFHSWGSARETFDWIDMCEVKLPIPEIEVQKSIVAIHHTLETRKRINTKLKNLVKPLCPILIRGVINNLSLVTADN